MAFQFTNYAALPTQGAPVARDLVSSLLEGYKAARTPKAIGQQEQQRDLANALAKIQVDQEPERFRSQMDTQSLLNALRGINIKKGESELSDPFLGKMAHGDVADSVLLDRIERFYGKDSQQAKNAREAMEKKLKPTESPTTATITANQKVVNAVDNVLPLIEELKTFDSPNQLIGKYVHPDMQAAYNAKVGTIVDSLVGALKLPQVKESLSLVDKIVRQQPFESRSSYISRLGELAEELKARKERASNIGNTKVQERDSRPKRLKFNPKTGGFDQ